MKLKKKLKFKVGDEVITTTDHDGDGDKVFPTGTKGVVTGVFKEEPYPYKVVNEDGDYWFYNDEMLKEDNEKYLDNIGKLDIEAYLIAGEVLEKTNGNDAKIREVIYNLNNFLKYKGV